MSMTVTDKLLAVAYGYEQEIPFFHKGDGLCIACGDSTAIKKHASQWGEVSGETGYPVPSPEGYVARIVYYLTDDLYSGEYGDLRRDLARHVAHEMLKAEGKW